MDTKFKLLTNRYVGKTRVELRKIYREKRAKYDHMMKILNPISFGREFLDSSGVPLWVKIAHIDEFLECPHCLEEYRKKIGELN